VFRGQVANSEVLDDYARQPYDWFINVSASEGLPVSIMEVCSFGIPVIATDVGGTAEIVRDGCNGFLIDAEAGADVIAAALKRVALLDEPTRQQFRSAARQTWEAGFNADTNYRKFAAAVRSYLPSVGGATA
jgi:glycosyltransferase involved in cell wall biosynthesis